MLGIAVDQPQPKDKPIVAGDCAAAVPLPDVTTALDDKAKPKGAQEFGGQKGPEPTRYGDWENKGRCTDF